MADMPSDRYLPLRNACDTAMKALVGATLLTTAIPYGATFGDKTLPIFDVMLFISGLAGLIWITSTKFATRKGGPAPLRQVSVQTIASVAFVLSVALSNARHPSFAGNVAVFRVGALVLLATVSSHFFRAGANLGILRAVWVFATFEFALALAEVMSNRVVFGSLFGESEGGFRRINGLLAPCGSLSFANALGVVSATGLMVLIAFIAHHPLSRFQHVVTFICAIMSCATTLLTLSRSAFLAVITTIVSLAIASTRKRFLRPFTGALVLTTIAVLVLRLPGWTARASVSAAGAEAAGSGRLALARQAIAIFRLDPVLGVGPGGYFQAIRANPVVAAITPEWAPVHNVALFVLATIGLVGIAAFSILGLALLRRALAGGVLAVGILLALLPPLMLDSSLFGGTGTTWTATAIGISLGLGRMKKAAPAPTKERPIRFDLELPTEPNEQQLATT
jgi:O-antigen ligase